MNGYARRLDRLAGWEAERRHDAAERAAPIDDRYGRYAGDPAWLAVWDQLCDLADAVTTPAPTWFVAPVAALAVSRRRYGLTITLAAYRAEIWRQHVVLESPAGRRLYQQLLAIQARHDANDTAIDASPGG